MESVRTIHVDDHPLYCIGLRAALSTAADLDFVGEAHTAAGALELATREQIDVALLDMVLPTSDGVALTAAILGLQPKCKVIGLSMVVEPVRIAQMFRAGASGYALKSQSTAELLQAIRTVLSGEEYLASEISSEQVQRHRSSRAHSPEKLTRRERQVFVSLVAGQSNLEIAAALAISRRTVETHRQRILTKLDAHSLLELVGIARRYGVA